MCVTTIGFIIQGKEYVDNEFMPMLGSVTFLQLTLILSNRIVRVHSSANHHLAFITWHHRYRKWVKLQLMLMLK